MVDTGSVLWERKHRSALGRGGRGLGAGRERRDPARGSGRRDGRRDRLCLALPSDPAQPGFAKGAPERGLAGLGSLSQVLALLIFPALPAVVPQSNETIARALCETPNTDPPLSDLQRFGCCQMNQLKGFGWQHIPVQSTDSIS